MRPTITVAVTVHGEWRPTEPFASALRSSDQIIILMSGWETPVERISYNTSVLRRKNYDDWGHQKRADAIAICETDYITFWNCDDEYSEDFLDKMLAQDADVVHCKYKHKTGKILGTTFKANNSTSGNFIIRTELAKKAGWNSREYCADGIFISDVNKFNPSVAFVDEILYTHR